MRIAVCIKQVPVLSAMQFDPVTKTLKREGVPTEVSAFDVRALIKAVELKGALGRSEVLALTMGPPHAREALSHCLALGADRAIHLCDRAFAGSDTLATARALALALARESVDLILCGRNSVDAETGQVGGELAELLNLPHVSGARTLVIDSARRELHAERETDDGFEVVVAPLPALVTAAEDLAPERFPTKAEREAARTKPCTEVHALDLCSDLTQFGVAGSPTEVAGLQQVTTARLGRLIEAASADEAAAKLTRVLIDEHGLFSRWTVHEQPRIAHVASAPRRTGASDVWVVAEISGDTIRPVALELLGKAAELSSALESRVTAVLLGHECERHARLLSAHGADRVLVADDSRLAPFESEVHAGVLAAAIRRQAPGILLIPSTSRGRDVAARVAARLQLGLTGDCVDIGLDDQGRLLQYKPAFGGSVVAPILSRTQPEMATVRPGVLPLPTPDPSKRTVIEQLHLDEIPAARARIVSRRTGAETAIDLDRAEIVIGAGIGLGDASGLSTLQPLIRLLGAAVCATRDVTDAGWLPKQYQVGLTGRAITPKLYIAVGIRGAFEHMVGVRNAGLIVAINKNPKAPVVKNADYSVVGNYADVVPALCRHLSEARSPALRL